MGQTTDLGGPEEPVGREQRSREEEQGRRDQRDGQELRWEQPLSRRLQGAVEGFKRACT